MVAVTDERAYARLVQPLQALDELELRAQAAVRRVIHVTRDEQRVHPLVDAQVDDVLIGRERSGIERVRHVVGSRRLQAGERTVEVQVGGVDEAEEGHVALLVARDSWASIADCMAFR